MVGKASTVEYCGLQVGSAISLIDEFPHPGCIAGDGRKEQIVPLGFNMSRIEIDVVASFSAPELDLLTLFNQHSQKLDTVRHTTPTSVRITTSPGATEGQVLTPLPSR